MNKKFKVLALAMSMAFVAPSMALAADSSLNQKIKDLDKQVSVLEDDYDKIYTIYQSMKGSSKAYTAKGGKVVTNKDALNENLFKVATKLDAYVSNVVPSMEQSMLSVYFMAGAKGNGYTIRKNNVDDLYNYVKKTFVMKKGVNKAEYEKLLDQYVDAIAQSVSLSDIDGATRTLYNELMDKKYEIYKAKLERRSYEKLRNKERVGELEKAIANAKIKLDACKKLLEIAPQKVAGVRDKLDKLMAEQEQLIKTAEKLVAKYK